MRACAHVCSQGEGQETARTLLRAGRTAVGRHDSCSLLLTQATRLRRWSQQSLSDRGMREFAVKEHTSRYLSVERRREICPTASGGQSLVPKKPNTVVKQYAKNTVQSSTRALGRRAAKR